MGSKKFGYELLERITRDLGDGIVLDMEPKFFGRHLAMVVSPTKKAIEKYAKTKNQKVNNKKV
jgi:translation initiation factor IF-3